MPVVFVVASDWTLRAAVRAQLREMGIDALGMDSADDVGHAVSSGTLPAVVVLEAAEEFLGRPGVHDLVHRVPTVLIASRTLAVPLPDGSVVLYRPVRVAEIVARVSELLARANPG